MSTIQQSVGKNGVNRRSDGKVVQILLNERRKKQGQPTIKEDELAGPATIAAIEKFQREIVGIHPDGLISPGMRTWKVLSSSNSTTPVATGVQTRWPGVLAKDSTVNLNGVEQRLIDYLVAVSEFYHKPIIVTSGMRDVTEQANVMWNKWENIQRGELRYIYLSNNPKEKAYLNDCYTRKDKEAFRQKIAQIGNSISRHLTGQAVDVSLQTPQHMLSALASCLHHYPEKTNAGVVFCHHFDLRDAKLIESVKPKWHA